MKILILAMAMCGSYAFAEANVKCEIIKFRSSPKIEEIDCGPVELQESVKPSQLGLKKCDNVGAEIQNSPQTTDGFLLTLGRVVYLPKGMHDLANSTWVEHLGIPGTEFVIGSRFNDGYYYTARCTAEKR